LLVRTIIECVLVITVVAVWNTHTDDVLFRPSSVRDPDATILKVPGVLQ
jgi:hypothetical protein